MKNIILFIFGVLALCCGCASENLGGADDGALEFKIAYDGEVQTFLFGELKIYDVEQIGVESYVVTAPTDWLVTIVARKMSIKAPSSATAASEDLITIKITSKNGTTKDVVMRVKLNVDVDDNVTESWREFVAQSEKNVLLDFSYAGYKHGEVGPPADVYQLGYKVFDITTYGAIANDEISDRQAFIEATKAAKANGSGVIKFPEGRFILHDETDNSDGRSHSIRVDMGNYIIKGAGQDKTTIVMKSPNLPGNPAVRYTSSMILIANGYGFGDITDVTGSAAKGSKSVEVASTAQIKPGDWVCLYLLQSHPDLVAEEFGEVVPLPGMSDVLSDGIEVNDYHQVVSVSGNVVTFKEPIMRAVNDRWNWKIRSFRNHENVGVEDVTFEGNCKENFIHGATWQDDCAYRPIDFQRLTNSWMRRVTFENVSEAVSVISCANVSLTDIKIIGRRGHSAIRSQGSSRVFMGKVVDNTNGRMTDGSGDKDGVGQWHACGVSKPSMGAVLWGLDWGTDSCFEAHARQPRATLVDNCHGALFNSRGGGSRFQLPNHLADLTLWNLNSKYTGDADNFYWWDPVSEWVKYLPPIIVGHHGASVKFDQTQVIRDESNGTKVFPESLYEAQLKQRLGYLPAWIVELK